MRRALAALALATLLALSGCLGALPGGGDPTLDDVEYPPGVSDSRVNATRLADAHEAGLDGRSFTLRMNATGAAGNRSQSVDLRGAVSADRDRMLVRVGAGVLAADVYLAEDAVYRRSTVGNRTSYAVRDRSPSALQPVPASPSGARYVRLYLSAANFTPVGVTVEDGTTLIVLAADADAVANSSFANVTRLDARVLVDERGVVHRISLDYAAETRGGGTVSATTTLRITDVGETEVPEPDWLDEAKAAANESG